jgi:hypothetical protein
MQTPVSIRLSQFPDTKANLPAAVAPQHDCRRTWAYRALRGECLAWEGRVPRVPNFIETHAEVRDSRIWPFRAHTREGRVPRVPDFADTALNGDSRSSSLRSSGFSNGRAAA